MSAPRMVLSGLNNRTMWRRTRPGSFSVNKLRAIEKADFRNSTVDFTDATIIGLQNSSSEQPFAYQGSVGNLDSTAVVDGTALTPMGKFLMPAKGWLTALSLQYTNPILTGSITVELTVSGIQEGTTTHPLSVGEQQAMTTRYDFGAKPPSIVRFTDSGVNLNLTTCIDRGILFRAGTSIQGTSNATINSDGSITLGSATINGNDITITNLNVDNLSSKTPGNPITVNGVPLDVGGSVDFFTITPDSGASSYTIRSFASVTTTDATPTTLLNMDTAFPHQGAYSLSLDVIGINQTTQDSCSFKVVAKFDRSSTNVKRITVPSLTNITDASLNTASIEITTTNLSVTGVAATTIKWTVSGQISVQKY